MIRPLAILSALTLPLVATAAAAADPRTAQVDVLFSAWDKPGSPGCATGVMSQGKLVYAKGHGLADVARGTPLSPDTVFDVASMAKQFTAASVALLSLDRKLALTDDVRARFPELHVDVPMKIENLLHHTSGVRDYAELNQLHGVEATDNSGVIAMLARQKALNFAPGSQSAYSNSNYVLLAELVQRTTGKSLATLARQRIFTPLKMQSTRYAGDLKDDPPNLANSYVPSAPGQFAPVTRDAQAVGDGNLLTTVRDLALWDENFYTHRVGGNALTQMMRTPATLASGKRVPYGLGLMFDDYRGEPTEHHGGSFHGFRTELLRFPKQHFSVSVLCNVASANASGLAAQVADIYLADVLQPRLTPAAVPTGAKIEAARFDAYTGEYVVDFNGPLIVLRFSRRGDQLFLQSSMGQPNEMIATSDTELIDKKTGHGRLTFEPGKLTLHRDEGDFVGQKISAAPASTDLAGLYYSEDADAGFRLQMTGDRVIVDAGHNRKFPIMQIAQSRYVMPGGATLEIQRGSDGQVSGFEYSSSRVAHLQFVRKAE